jgi:hypothetical protein
VICAWEETRLQHIYRFMRSARNGILFILAFLMLRSTSYVHGLIVRRSKISITQRFSTEGDLARLRILNAKLAAIKGASKVQEKIKVPLVDETKSFSGFSGLGLLPEIINGLSAQGTLPQFPIMYCYFVKKAFIFFFLSF